MFPRFRTWLQRRKPQPVCRTPRLRLFVELLEDRRLLAALIGPQLPPHAPSHEAGLALGSVASAPGSSNSANASGLTADWPAVSSGATAVTAVPQSSSAAANPSGFTADWPLVMPDSGESGVPPGYTPAQMRQAYGFNLLSGLQGNRYNNAGKGETIAIVDDYNDPDIGHDVQQFDEYFNIGGAANNPASTSFLKVVNQYGGSPLDIGEPAGFTWDIEDSIDVEWAHAIAPGANILLVEANGQDMADEDAAVQYAASYPNVCVVSMSFSSDVESYINNLIAAYDSLYTTPVGHQGVAFVAAAGDQGAISLYPQVSPNVLVVGGTTLPADKNGNPDRSQEIGWSLGSDANLPNFVYDAGGGGPSSYEALPAYQQGVVDNANTYYDTTLRAEPDVAYDADPATGVPIYDSLSTPPGDLPWTEAGGTSIGAPQWAALIAIADQARAARGEGSLDGPTQLLPAIYQIAQSDPHAFQGITQGYNGFFAGPGYNFVTGLGTPNAQYLIPDLVKIDRHPAAPATIYWTGDAGDNNWSDPGNWSYVDPARRNVPQSVLPGPNDNVVIDLAGATINATNDTDTGYLGEVAMSYDTIRSLTVTAPNVTLNLDYGTLDLSGSGTLGTFQVQITGDAVNLDGTVLKSADISSGTTIAIGNSMTGVVDGGTLNGTLQVLPGSTLVLEGSWTNKGTITAESSSTLVLGDYWNAAAADPGAASDAWINQGTITASNATVWLGGWLTNTPYNLGSLQLGTDTVELIGTLDNRHQTLSLSPDVTSSSGSWTLIGGRIDGGTITTSGGAALIATDEAEYEVGELDAVLDVQRPSGTLDGVTLDGTLDMSAGFAFVAVTGGITLDTDLYLSGYDAVLDFLDGSTVQAGPLVQSATIHMNGPYSYILNGTSQNAWLDNYPSQTVTFARDITVSGETPDEEGLYGPFDNLGTIVQNTAGQLVVEELTNEGAVEVGPGAAIALNSAAVSFGFYGAYPSPGRPWSNDAHGTITAASLQMLGNWTNKGTITAAGANADLGGVWTNSGTITVDATSSVTLGDYASAVSGPNYIWKNTGVLAIAPGVTLNLGDYFTTDEFESGFQQQGVDLNLAQDTVNLIGFVDNGPADNPITGGTLTLDASTGCGGEIEGGTITGTGSLVITGSAVFQDVELDTAVNVPGTRLDLQGSWTNNATITLTGAILNTSGTWTNNGVIAATGSYVNDTMSNGLPVSGIWTNNGAITATGSYFGLGGAGINDGAIAVTGSYLSLGGTWTNYGTITADAASTVGLGDFYSYVSGPTYIWENAGVLAIAPGATLYLGDYFTADEFASGFQDRGVDLNLAQYTVYLAGILDNSPADNPITGGTLALNASTGPLYLAGEIDQGTITTSGTDDLIATSGINFGYPYNPTLNGVTLDGTLDMSGNLAVYGIANVNIMGGLTLDTDLYLSGSGGYNAILDFLDGTTVSAGPLVPSATIYLSNDSGLLNSSNQTVTIGQGITISCDGSGDFIGGPIDNRGTIEENVPIQQPYRYLSVDDVDNDGTIEASNGGGIEINGLVNNGFIEASTGSDIELDGAFSPYPDNALYSIGLFELLPWSNNADGTITATQGGEVDLWDNWTNYGTITVASSSLVTLDQSGVIPLYPIQVNNGSIIIGSGGTLSTVGQFSGPGILNYVQSAGTTTVDGLLIATNVFINGGLLTGAGTIQANVTNAGTVEPGDAAGDTLTIQGNYTQTATGVLLIQIAGPSQYGQLAITGSATLAGTLQVSLLDGYVPTDGTSFQIMTFADYTGGFSTEIGLKLHHHRHLNPEWSSDDLTLTVE